MFLRLLYIAVFIVAVVFAYKQWTIHSGFAALAEASLGNAIGPEAAEVTLIEIIDYRCSLCRRVHPVVQELQKRNPKLRVVYRHLPVFMEPSVYAAEVALAAGMQGHFEEAHNILMDRQETVDDAFIQQISNDLGLDHDKFMKDLKGPEIGYELLETIDVTKRLGINRTPTFLIGKTVFEQNDSVVTVEDLEAFIAHTAK